jgi:type I restriction enzyme, S subunit
VKEDFWPLNTSLYVEDFRGHHRLFTSYFLRTLNFANQNAAGAVPGVNRNALHMLPVCIPPIPIQRRIACILSAYDDLIENNTRRIRILEEMAQAIYREWFVHFRFPGHKNVKLVPSPLGPIPPGWGVKRVTNAVFVDPKTAVPREGEKPFVPMGSLSNDSMLVRDVGSRSGNSGSKFKNGDTLFARITPCLENGKTAFVQFLPTEEDVAFGSTEFIVLRSKTLSPEFVYLLARSPEFRNNAIKSMSGATGRQRVQPACFEKFRLAHPDASTLRVFGEQVAPMFQEVHLIAQENENLRKTRDLLLPKLISGELEVSDIDINVGDAAA